jgi:hypothetical protein
MRQKKIAFVTGTVVASRNRVVSGWIVRRLGRATAKPNEHIHTLEMLG